MNAKYRNPQNDTEQYRLTATAGSIIRLGLSVSRLPGGRVRIVAHAKFDTKVPISGSAVKPGKPRKSKWFSDSKCKSENIIKLNVNCKKILMVMHSAIDQAISSITMLNMVQLP